MRFPNHQPLRGLNAVAVLEADDARFRERAVAHLESGLRLGDVLQRDVHRAAGVVAQQGVALAEGAALHVFAGQPDGHAVGQDGSEGQRLGRGPIDGGRVRVSEDVAPPLQRAGQLLVEAEAGRQA